MHAEMENLPEREPPKQSVNVRCREEYLLHMLCEILVCICSLAAESGTGMSVELVSATSRELVHQGDVLVQMCSLR